MIEIITHLDNITLDLAPNTVLSFDENSKGFDSNAFVFDYTNNINLPYSPRNVDLFNRYGYEKFKVIVKSDGLFIGNFYAKFTENNVNLNTYSGTYTLDIFSVFKDLNDTASDTRLKDAYIYLETIDAADIDEELLLNETEPKLHAALRLLQSDPNLNKPYRFPEFHLVGSPKGEGDNPFEPDFGETLKEDFGNLTNVNHLNNTYHVPLPGEDWSVNWLVLSDRGGYDPFIKQQGGPILASYNQTLVPRRIWGLVSPCFNYMTVIEESIKSMGYSVRFDWTSGEMESFYRQIYILNNHNIYNCEIERYEGIFDWIFINPSGTPSASASKVYNFVKDNRLYFYEWTSIDSKNHLPDISVLDLIVDFLAKTNSIIDIEGDTIVFKQIKIKQSELDLELNPNIRTVKYEYLEDRFLKYNYTEEENIDNIQDYRLSTLNKNSQEISSDIVPVHVRTLLENAGTGAKSFFPYILGAPSVDKERCISKTEYLKDTGTYHDGTGVYQFTSVPSGEPNTYLYSIQPCPLYCSTVHYFDNLGVSLWHRYFPRPTGLFFYYVCVADEEWREIDVIRSLRWEGEKGIFEHQYKPTLLILMAKLISYVKAKVSVEMFSKFNHYHYFPINGKRGFPLKRKYKLPLSSDNQIEIDLYLVD